MAYFRVYWVFFIIPIFFTFTVSLLFCVPLYIGTFDQTKNWLFNHNLGQWIMTSVKAHKNFKMLNVCGLHHYFWLYIFFWESRQKNVYLVLDTEFLKED